MTQRQLKKHVGERIKYIRELNNISQEELAKKVKLSRASIINIEAGRHGTTLFTLLKICDALICSIKVLVPKNK